MINKPQGKERTAGNSVGGFEKHILGVTKMQLLLDAALTPTRGILFL